MPSLRSNDHIRPRRRTVTQLFLPAIVRPVAMNLYAREASDTFVLVVSIVVAVFYACLALKNLSADLPSAAIVKAGARIRARTSRV